MARKATEWISGRRADRPAKLNIVRNYAVTEDRCQEELRFWEFSVLSRQPLLSFSSHVPTFGCGSTRKPVISTPRYCDPQHRTVRIRSRNSSVVCFAQKRFSAWPLWPL